MSESIISYLKLFHYPLKLEYVIDNVNYFPFCNNRITQHYHKSLLLYVICKGYPFEKILLDNEVDMKKIGGILSICNDGNFYYIKLKESDIFNQIADKYHTHSFLEHYNDSCYRIKDECLEHIYHIAEKTLYDISKNILYKHFLLYYNNSMPSDIINYIIYFSLNLIKQY